MGYCLQPDRPLDSELRQVALGCIDDALVRLSDLHGADPADIETAVHEVRKRCKELRGLARLVRPALGDGYAACNGEARDAAKELSSIRDAHALLATVEDLQGDLGDAASAQLEAIRGHHAVLAAAASHALDADDPRIIRAIGRLGSAREMVAGWRLADDVATIEQGLARTYRRGRKALRAARKHPDDHRVHEWRKAVKYLWYQVRLLQPAAPERLAPLVQELDDLSDLLGDDHDLAVLAARLEGDQRGDLDEKTARHGAELARRRQTELRSAAFDLGRRVYDPKPSAFVAELTAPWRAAIDRRHAEDSRHATVERERKFLVADMPTLPDESTAIRQGYVAIDGDVSVRVRDADGTTTMTVKGGAGSVRTEVEWSVGADRFDALWALTGDRRIEKTRYVLPVVGGQAELDVFGGALTGLVVVEVEFDSDEDLAAFQPPDWFGTEVTDDLRYTNASLALDGLGPLGSAPSWSTRSSGRGARRNETS